jgi:hypothetical protein
MVLNTLKDSAITRTELFYQQREQAPKRSFRRVIHVLAVVLSVLCVIAGLISLETGRRFANETLLRAGLGGYYALVFGLHFMFVLRTLHLSSSAISRERRYSERWESLLLTGVSGREIVFGKWWATVRTMWRDYLLLGVLRAAILTTISTVALGFTPYAYSRYNATHANISTIIVASLMVIAFTFMNLLYTAACGVLSSIVPKRGGGVMRAFVVRTLSSMLVVTLPFLLWFFIGMGWLNRVGALAFPNYLEVNIFIAKYAGTMLDNGIWLSNQYIFDGHGASVYTLHIPSIFVLTFATYAVLTWALLWIAQRRAERFGALKSAETKGK